MFAYSVTFVINIPHNVMHVALFYSCENFDIESLNNFL
jgi:hypothetical protein